LRPDRLVVGEVRGAEALDLLRATQTGHAGVLATVHAGSTLQALERLELLVLGAGTALPLAAIRTQIAASFPYVVCLQRSAGRRRLSALSHVAGCVCDHSGYRLEPIYPTKE
jgi:pilus assembly protein CpaF